MVNRAAAAVWTFMDGWKLPAAIVTLAGVKVYDATHGTHAAGVVQAVLALMGVDPSGVVDYGTLVPALGIVLASAHKVVKAKRQYKAGSSVSGLLSTEGAVQEYIDKAQKQG